MIKTSRFKEFLKKGANRYPLMLALSLFTVSEALLHLSSTATTLCYVFWSNAPEMPDCMLEEIEADNII